MDSGFKKFPSIHDRLAIEMKRYLQEKDIPEWTTKRKTTLIQKDPTKRNRSKQLQTHNVPTDDVENTNDTTKGRDLLLVNKLQIVPRGTERMLQVDQRRAITH